MGLKIWIENKILNSKRKIKEYFLLKNSLDHLENFIKNFYLLSVGFDDIYYGNKNIKRFKICIANCVIVWLVLIFFLSLVLSDKMFSLMGIPSLFAEKLKMLIMLFASIAFAVGIFKTGYFFGEINYNLSPFKVFYYLMMDWKYKHKLNDKNYMKLAIWSRILQIVVVDCGTNVLVFASLLFTIKLAFVSHEPLLWTPFIIVLIPIYFSLASTGTLTICIYFTLFAYYNMIFKQINDEFNFSLNRKKISKITRSKQFISLIDQHNQFAKKIQMINLILRKTLAALFINLSIMKILSIYLLIIFDEVFIKIILAQIIVVVLIFGFGVSYLFTRQIKSAHQPFKIIHSFVCKNKINLRFKLKVKNN